MAWGDGWLGAGGEEGAAGGFSFVYLVSLIPCVSCIVIYFVSCIVPFICFLH